MSEVMMTITANGQQYEVTSGSTIADFLRQRSIDPLYVVVQMDGEIIGRAAFSTTVLPENSSLEIVTLVGGG